MRKNNVTKVILKDCDVQNSVQYLADMPNKPAPYYSPQDCHAGRIISHIPNGFNNAGNFNQVD